MITLNGVDIAEYDNADYTRLFSVVFQDFKLFSFPLDQNIAASEEVDTIRMEQHLKSAGLNELVEELKGDYCVAIGKQTDDVIPFDKITGIIKEKTSVKITVKSDPHICVVLNDGIRRVLTALRQ